MAELTRRWPLVLALAALLAGAIVWRAAHDRLRPVPSSSTEPPLTYVGSETCASCHAAAYAAWHDSQHARAMAPATDRSVLGRFDGRSFRYGSITSTFFRRDGKFIVRTDGPAGAVRDFEVTHTFGVFPLQQYLIELPGGRLQALGIAWDARPESAGGQRWFHLYPGEALKAGDPLHWTGLAQNWNFMCADCHSTNVRKGYNAESRTFHTTWSEISVGCEACHGPASGHVAWARRHGAAQAGSFLTSPLKGAGRGQWIVNPSSGLPARKTPRRDDAEIEVCARCHSRRSQMTDEVRAGDPLEAAFRPTLLEPPFFSADGQMREEVYNYASFLESRMYARGVTCGDCHDPHSAALRFPGNATCTQCHAAATYDRPAHHGHHEGTAAAACPTCHMPSKTYMIVDVRHDHGFRVPRPDRSAALGTADVCTTACHRDRDASWAANVLKRRTGLIVAGFQRFAEAFGAFDRGASDATAGLLGVVNDSDAPPIVRASALERLANGGEPFDVSRVSRAFADPSPLVRRAALEALRVADDGTRLRRRCSPTPCVPSDRRRSCPSPRSRIGSACPTVPRSIAPSTSTSPSSSSTATGRKHRRIWVRCGWHAGSSRPPRPRSPKRSVSIRGCQRRR